MKRYRRSGYHGYSLHELRLTQAEGGRRQKRPRAGYMQCAM